MWILFSTTLDLRAAAAARFYRSRSSTLVRLLKSPHVASLQHACRTIAHMPVVADPVPWIGRFPDAALSCKIASIGMGGCTTGANARLPRVPPAPHPSHKNLPGLIIGKMITISPTIQIRSLIFIPVRNCQMPPKWFSITEVVVIRHSGLSCDDRTLPWFVSRRLELVSILPPPMYIHGWPVSYLALQICQ